MLRKRGSISVEAAVVMPAVMMFFLAATVLLNMLLVRADFEKCVAQTTARLAETAYAVSLLNQLTDEIMMSGGSREAPADLDPEADISDLIAQLVPTPAGLLPHGATEALALGYSALKSRIAGNSAYSLLGIYSDSKFGRDNVRLGFVQLPQSVTEFYANNVDPDYRGKCLMIGFYPDIEDVALYAEYEYRLVLPFIGTRTVIFRKLCVERAWIRGANDIGDIIDLIGDAVTSVGPSDPKDPGETVFITRTGIRYHAGWCMYLYKSKYPVTIGEAVTRGYTPCKVCMPR